MQIRVNNRERVGFGTGELVYDCLYSLGFPLRSIF